MVDHENYSNIKSGDESKARVKVTFNSIQFNLEFLFSRILFQAPSDHPGEGTMESSELDEKTEGTAREAAPTGIPI